MGGEEPPPIPGFIVATRTPIELARVIPADFQSPKCKLIETAGSILADPKSSHVSLLSQLE